mmetsp:Transcript_27339/g.53237  ORF Transcript_27339/g.53237 Transcript_27339/m.53237 type:complete len:367 (+) Transcript_27339:41-1141(+)
MGKAEAILAFVWLVGLFRSSKGSDVVPQHKLQKRLKLVHNHLARIRTVSTTPKRLHHRLAAYPQATVQTHAHLRTRSPKDAVPLHYMEIGCGDVMQSREPIIIIHGLLGNSMNFHSWANDLFSQLESTRRIIVPDLRNHGQSPHHNSMSYREMMEDVLTLMDNLGVDKAELIGHSLGGKIACAIALCHPERVKTLAVLDIAPVSYSQEDAAWWQVDKVIHAMARLPLEEVDNRDEADSMLSVDIEDPILRRFALTNLIPTSNRPGYSKWRWRINVQSIKNFLPSIRDFDIGQGSGDLAGLGVRFGGDVFFVSGRRSKYISTRHLPTIANLFPRYNMMTIKNAGHWVHSEDPVETLRLVKMFLDVPR